MVELPELVETMARNLAPHHLPHYAVELATALQRYYQLGKREGRYRVVLPPDEIATSKARLKLVDAARVILARCLALMIMEAPEEM